MILEIDLNSKKKIDKKCKFSIFKDVLEVLEHSFISF